MSKKNDQHFSTEHLRTGLKERAIKSVAVTLAAQGIKLLLQIGSMVILARLLDPSDFGLVAMVTVFTGLAMQVTDGGLSMATIQRENITHAQVSNLFWVNAAMGTFLCFVFILVSPYIAMLYGEPDVAIVLSVMSVTFFVAGISVQHDALLRRKMRFKALSVIDIVSMALGAVSAVTGAMAGLNYWALVLAPVVTALSKTLMRWMSVKWIPSMMSRGSGVRPMLAFGANLTAANFLGYFTNNVTPFGVGYVGSAQLLGLFNRANALTTLPSSQLLPPIMNVLQPTVSRMAGDEKKLRKTILSLIGKLVVTSTFISAGMFLFADWLVLIFLGEKWEEAVFIFRMLAVYSFVQPLAGLIAVCLIAIGESRAIFYSKIHSLIITSASLLVGALWGVNGLVLAFSLSGLLVRLPVFICYSCRFLPLSPFELAKPIFPSVLCGSLSVMATYYSIELFNVVDPITGFFVFFPVFVLTYLFCCFFVRSTRRDVAGLLKSIGFLISQGWMGKK